MGHLLITGFDPFGGGTINPAWEAVKRLPDVIGGYRLTKLMIPTVFEAAARRVLDAAREEMPDVILCIGQAGTRSAVTPEKIAVNLMHARIADNSGRQPEQEPVIPGGPDGIFATVPVFAMAQAISGRGIPASVSLSAGSFVCNDTFYRLLYHYAGTNTRVGFVHVPYLPQQAPEGVPYLELNQIVSALEAAVLALDQQDVHHLNQIV